MQYDIEDILEYTEALVDEFGKQFNLTGAQAYQYLKNFKGINLIEDHYGIIHTLDFREAVDSVAIYCRRMGGTL